MIILLWILLLIIPVLIGAGVLTIVYRKKTGEVIGFSDCFVCGFIVAIGVAEAAHGIGFFLRLSLRTTGTLLLALWGLVAILALIVAIKGIRDKRLRLITGEMDEPVNKALPIALLGLFFLQAMYIFCVKALVVPGDITLETVQSFLAEDGIYRVMPLTGSVSEAGVPLRYSILCLPTLYGVLSQKTSLNPELVVCHIIPVVVLAAGYLSYFRFSESLFGRTSLRKRYLFLVIVALLLWFSDQGVYLDGYSALHAGYLGTGIRNLILVPFTFSAMLERRYWKAILCILAELCIVWTFWGLGVCVAVTLGMLILELLERKVAFAGKFLQIFRKKEEQR